MTPGVERADNDHPAGAGRPRQDGRPAFELGQHLVQRRSAVGHQPLAAAQVAGRGGRVGQPLTPAPIEQPRDRTVEGAVGHQDRRSAADADELLDQRDVRGRQHLGRADDEHARLADGRCGQHRTSTRPRDNAWGDVRPGGHLEARVALERPTREGRRPGRAALVHDDRPRLAPHQDGDGRDVVGLGPLGDTHGGHAGLEPADTGRRGPPGTLAGLLSSATHCPTDQCVPSHSPIASAGRPRRAPQAHARQPVAAGVRHRPRAQHSTLGTAPRQP